MDNVNFFSILEKKLKAPIPTVLKAHMQFHHLNNFYVAAMFLEKGTSLQLYTSMEDFAKKILYHIIEPQQKPKYYGEFVKNPECFVFTEEERKYLIEVLQVCKQLCQNEN
ncbi:hypothetical protein WA026_023086 [Henosepilachna vigintioctopunctata]|uniref:Uncharacterized protein n=1 Tax=Henosepilachna vigintioctopunctata TaxID=420089 RepID=A0AAW1U4K2_9CUCU